MPAQLKAFLAVLGPITLAAISIAAIGTLSPAFLAGFSGFLKGFAIMLGGLAGCLFGWQVAISRPIDALMRTRQSLEVVSRRSETAEVPDREMALSEVATMLRESGEAVATRMAQEGQVNTALMRREGELYAMLTELREKHEAMLRGDVTEGELGHRLEELTTELEQARARAAQADKRQADLLDHLGRDLRAPAQEAIALLDEIEPVAVKAKKKKAFKQAREALRVLLGIANDGADQLKQGTTSTPEHHPAQTEAGEVEAPAIETSETSETTLISKQDRRALRQARALRRKKRQEALERRAERVAAREARAKRREKLAAIEAKKRAAEAQAEAEKPLEQDQSSSGKEQVAKTTSSDSSEKINGSDKSTADQAEATETEAAGAATDQQAQAEKAETVTKAARPVRKVRQGKTDRQGITASQVSLGPVSLSPVVVDNGGEVSGATDATPDGVTDADQKADVSDTQVPSGADSAEVSEADQQVDAKADEVTAETSERSTVIPASASTMPASGSLRVLAADDNAVGRLLIETLLKREGHLVTMVENGSAAVDAAQNQDFDLIMLDHAMPDLTGAETLHAIRSAGSKSSYAPALLVKRVDQTDRQALRSALKVATDDGFAAILPRPVKSDILLPLIAKLQAALNGQADASSQEKVTADAAE
ncbi:MAG: hypothetical protein Alpg2KO_01940 [Alphaproteobacteria bacterium]